jgi:Mg-chelatase subunit ChlD
VSFAHPAALWLGLLALPVLLLHVLRPRRQEVTVSSTYLWRSLATPVSAASPWQRLRPSVLLILQLLAVALLAIAAARPVRVTDAPLAEHTVFIIDASGSMAARDGDPDRLADAKDEARDLRDELPAGGRASVVVASASPRVALTASADKRAFDEAIGPIETSAGRADFAGAFTLGESLETPGTPIGFVLLSDGGLTDAEQRLLPPGTEYVAIGDRATNRAIGRLSVEPRGSDLHARVFLRNTGGPDATQTLRLDVDGRTVHEQTVSLATKAAKDIDVDLPAGDRVEAFLEGDDLLDADDHAFAVAARRRPLKVLLAGPEEPFVANLLAATPGVTVERSEVAIPAPGFDLVIYSGVDVPADPQAPFLAVASPGGAPGIDVVGQVETPAVARVAADDPLVEGLDLSDVAIATAQQVRAPTAEVVVGAEGAPLLVRGTHLRRPFAYLAFALADSNLGVQVVFPILGDRLLTELAGAALPPSGLTVGAPLPVDAGVVAEVRAPGGAASQVVPGAPTPVATRPGFWTIVSEGRPERVVAVNADPAESALAPAPGLPTEPRDLRPGERAPAGESSLLRWVVLALLVVLVLELLFARRSVGVSRRQWRAALVLRAVVAALLVGALVGFSFTRQSNRVATMFLIDGSDSLGGARSDAIGWVRDALEHQPHDALAGVALFGGDARLELILQRAAALEQPAVRIDPTRTNLAGALRLAAAVLPEDARRRIVLVSDGRANEGDAVAEAARLREAGIDVDVHTVTRNPGADVAVAKLDAPGLARQGEEVEVDATIYATVAGPVELILERDGAVVDRRVVPLTAGENAISLPQVATGGGLARYSLRVAGAGDAVPENDVGYTAIQIDGPAKVLVAEGTASNATTLVEALRAGGLQVDVVPSAALPPIDELSTYSATVLVDVDARTLSVEQVGALGAVSRDLGRGLVTIGGDRSFGPGGYLDSDLERLLPVSSDVTDPKRRKSVAEVLAIDTSGSMSACHCNEGANGVAAGGNRGDGGVNKTAISRAAAARTIDALSENDEVGVLAFNTEERWVIDLQRLPSDEVVTKGLRSLHPDGGTDVRQSLTTAAAALKASKASLKHIILFTDGFTAPDALDGLAREAADLAAQGITVSVLATGEGAATELSRIAEAGNGRFYPGRDLQQIPQIMREEAIIASRNFVNEGEFLPEVVSNAEPVRDLSAAPPLLGFIATTAKSTAEVMLRVGPDRDPLLASWQVGLGRSTAWTSDASVRWSKQWATWDGYVSFWSDVVKDTFPTASDAGAVRATVVDGVLRVSVEGETAWPDGSSAVARVASPDLTGREVPLERISGTTFAGEVPVGMAGTYAVGAIVRGPEGTLLSAATRASNSYAAEYRPGNAEPATLLRLSKLTGGRGAIEPEAAFAAAGLRVGRSRIELAGWFLLAAALLWPVAVAASRLALRGALVDATRRGARGVTGGVRRRLPAWPGTPPPKAPPSRAPRRESRRAAPSEPPATVRRLLERKTGSGRGSDRPDDHPRAQNGGEDAS